MFEDVCVESKLYSKEVQFEYSVFLHTRVRGMIGTEYHSTHVQQGYGHYSATFPVFG
jgi:hypothetical protein